MIRVFISIDVKSYKILLKKHFILHVLTKKILTLVGVKLYINAQVLQIYFPTCKQILPFILV